MVYSSVSLWGDGCVRVQAASLVQKGNGGKKGVFFNLFKRIEAKRLPSRSYSSDGFTLAPRIKTVLDN